jgi:Tol biopolymer transport system component
MLTICGSATLVAAGVGVTVATGAAASTGVTGQMRATDAGAHLQNGRIVFQAFVGRFPQVFTIEPDGSGLRQITHVPHKDPGAEHPTWSPDGTTIAFDAASKRGVDIFTVSPPGRPAKLPLRVGDFNGDPAYSPNGRRISFDQDTGPSAPKVHGIFIAQADGSHARRLTTAIRTDHSFDTESQWSPDGERIAFTRVKNSKQAAVFVVNVDGTGLRRLTPWTLDAASPDWSPDGRRIVFSSYFDYHPGKPSEIYTIRPDGTHRTLLTPTHGGVQSYTPSWSPDGRRVVFARFTPTGKRTGRGDLYIMNPNGTHLRRLTNIPHAFPSNPDWGSAPAESSPTSRF